MYVWVRPCTQHTDLATISPRHREPALHGGCDVVGVTFHLGSNCQQTFIVESLVTADGQCTSRGQAADDGSSRRPKTPAVRNAVKAADFETPRPTTHTVEGSVHRLHHEVARILAHLLSALTGHVEVETVFSDPHHDLVGERQRQPEAVVARAEIGAGRRYPHAQRCRAKHRCCHYYVNPSKIAAAWGSAATVTGLGAPAIAQSGSFRPWPVTVHTTV